MGGPKYYSPLRYPGGKGKLANYIKFLLECNYLLDGHYVEPYAGGAAVAIDLLLNEYVTEIHINDIDRSIFSFWHSVLNETDRLCESISNTTLSIDEWKRQRDIYRNAKNHSMFDLGFATFYLNRTNRSGILTAGVIGGMDQNGKWKIGARFSKGALIERIINISGHKERINLYNEDAFVLTKRLARFLPRKAFYYFDPPYYSKGKELYVNYYQHQDHLEIAKTISTLEDKYWLISYDNVNVIRELYRQHRQQKFTLNYSATEPKKGTEVLIFSDSLDVPEITNPTHKSEILQYK